METLSPKQLMALALIVSLSGAGGSLLTARPTHGPSTVAVLRDELDRLERRHEALMLRVRHLEIGARPS